MSQSKHNGHNNESNPGHEVDNVQVAGIAWFIVLLTVGVVFVGWLMVALFNTFEGREGKAELESRPSPFAAERPKLPPEPRLQLAPNSEEQIEKREPPDLKKQHPLEEMKELRANWETQLKSYGWVDEQNGIVRMPIEDAKKLLLQRGLPTRPVKKPETEPGREPQK
jgi:hypothetical protein